jgi:hypothetical protein
MRFRKRPVVIEAMQLPAPGQDTGAFNAWAAAVGFPGQARHGVAGLAIATLEGTMQADPGDWVIRGVHGEFYPCKSEIFAKTYEPADT